jgi:TonB-linked SusC/RagA family outer membrane protein
MHLTALFYTCRRNYDGCDTKQLAGILAPDTGAGERKSYRPISETNILAMTSIPPKRERSHRTISTTIRLAMKLIAIMLLTACLTASANGLAQTISLRMNSASLEKVFTEIKKQTGYSIFCNYKLLEKSKPVTINVSKATIEEVMTLCLKNQDLDYEMAEKSIVIKEKITSPKESAINEKPLLDISGKVTDAEGKPLPGATVKVKGSNMVTTTNNDGVFVLKGVDNDATLIISYVGFETFSVAINNKTSIVANLKIKPENLNEIIINKGYYSEQKKTSVSNVGIITAKDIEKQPVNNPLLALQGRVPGVFVTQNTGISGGGVTVRIQGVNSILNGNDPLYVIDGVPYISQLPQLLGTNTIGSSGGYINGQYIGSGNPLSYINPMDIESMSVLKDADATAIYGSRAANGAILITTKKGKAGEAKVHINMQQGWGVVGEKIQMLNTQQYLQMRREAFKNDGLTPNANKDYDLLLWDTTRYTDWQKTLIGGTAQYSNINADVSGGTSMMQYLIGATYNRQTTVFPADYADQKFALHFNVNGYSTNKKFHIQLSGNYLLDNNELPNNDLTERAIITEPDAPAIYHPDGSLNWAPTSSGTSSWTNPIASLTYNTYQNRTNNLVSNLLIGYRLLQGLEIKSSFGYNNLQTNATNIYPSKAVVPENRSATARSATYSNGNISSWIAEPQLEYNRKIGAGNLNALAGTSFQQNKTNVEFFNGTGYNSDDVLSDIGTATSLTEYSSFSTYRYNAFFGRVNYSWQDKYIMNLTGRRDGSSRFGDKNKFHSFWSVGGAWIFSSENFIKQVFPFLMFGKLRASYGTTGNDQIGDFLFLDLYSNSGGNVGVPYQGISTLYPQGFPNPYLAWEETRKLSFGLDLAFLNERVILNSTYAINRSSNQLLPYSLPSFTGFQSITSNFPASIQNTNLEISLNTKNIEGKKLSWESGLTLTIARNKLLDFPDLENSSYAEQLVIGHPVDVGKQFHYIGVHPVTGEYLFSDVHGSATTLPKYNVDNTVLVSRMPTYYGGFQNTFSYKGFELDLLFQFVKQLGYNFVFYNGGTYVPGTFGSGYSNQPVTVLNRWRQPGDHSLLAKYTTNRLSGLDATANVDGSDATNKDASYIRLKNLSISWQLPLSWSKKAHLENVAVYLHGQNLWTLTRYKGLDPETQSLTKLPPLRVWTVGIQLGL